MKIFEIKGLLLLLVFLGASSAFSQQYLYIKKKGEIPSERIGLNQRINFKIQGEKEWISGLLKELNGNSLKVNDRLFYFSNIEAIRTHNSLLKTLGAGLWVGGVFFTSIAAVNSVINSESPILSNNQLLVGGGLGLIGLIVDRLSKKTYSKEKGYYFEVINLDEE